jgi:hypothetical protein
MEKKPGIIWADQPKVLIATYNCIVCVMVSVLTPSVVDRGFELWFGQIKDYKYAFVVSFQTYSIDE